MNAWYLVAAMIVAFAFGYRFYAKLLALDIFRLDNNYSTPAQSRADGREYVPTHRQFLLGHHLAAVGGAAMFAAPIAALAWGWVPAFLWITVGSAVAAGTYGLGCFWLSLHYPQGLRQVAAELIGARMRTALFLLALTALVIVVAACAGFTAAILARYPGSVLPLAGIALVALALGNFLHGRAESVLLPAALGAFAASLLCVWLLGDTALAVSGALAITLGESTVLSIDAVLVWVVLLLLYAFHAARLPVWQLMRPRGALTSLLLAVTLLIFYVALAVEPPSLVAPQFHAPPSTAGALPWLFLIVGPGALAGWQLLIIHDVTAREMQRETDARYVGYGAALAQGIVALSALLMAATDFANTEAWTAYYLTAPNIADFPRLTAFYIDNFGRHAAALGLDASFARNLAATVIAGLTLAVLEGAVRAFKHVVTLQPATPTHARARTTERGPLWVIVLAAGALALYDGHGLGGLAAWPVLALISLWLAAAGFALVALALQAQGRPPLFIGTIAVIVAALAAWSTVAQLESWWEQSAWIELATGSILLLLVASVLREMIDAWRKARPKPSGALDS